jgi:hypothetical protein
MTLYSFEFKPTKKKDVIFFRFSAAPMSKNCTFAARKFKNVNL